MPYRFDVVFLYWNGICLLVLSAIAFFSIFIFRTVKNVLQRTSLEASWDFDLLCFLMVRVGYPLFLTQVRMPLFTREYFFLYPVRYICRVFQNFS